MSERRGKEEIQTGTAMHQSCRMTEDMLLRSWFTYCRQLTSYGVAAQGPPALLN